MLTSALIPFDHGIELIFDIYEKMYCLQQPNHWILTTAITGISTPRFPALLEAWERKRKLSVNLQKHFSNTCYKTDFKHQAFLLSMQMKIYIANNNSVSCKKMCMRWPREHPRNPQRWAHPRAFRKTFQVAPQFRNGRGFLPLQHRVFVFGSQVLCLELKAGREERVPNSLQMRQ